MTVAVVVSRARAGVHAPLVMVEVHFAGGVPAFNLVGLPETDVKESRDRVRAALQTRSSNSHRSRWNYLVVFRDCRARSISRYFQ